MKGDKGFRFNAGQETLREKDIGDNPGVFDFLNIEVMVMIHREKYLRWK
jgi:hypothetical protein